MLISLFFLIIIIILNSVDLIGGDVYRVDVVEIVDGRRIIGGKPTVKAATKPDA